MLNWNPFKLISFRLIYNSNGKDFDAENVSKADGKVVRMQDEGKRQQTTSAVEESQVKPEVGPCWNTAVTTAGSVVPTKGPTTQPIKLNTSLGTSEVTSCTTMKKKESGKASTSGPARQNVKSLDVALLLNIPDSERGKTVKGSSFLKASIGETRTVNTNISLKTTSASVSKVLKAGIREVGEKSSACDKVKLVETVEPKKSLYSPENALLLDIKELPGSVLTYEKSVDERQSNGLKNTESVRGVTGVTMTTTQLPSLTKTVESKLSVAVVSNSAPSVTTTTMNKSISPVIKAVSSSKPVDMGTIASVPSTLTVTMNTSLSNTGSVVYTGSVTSPMVSSVARPTLTPMCSNVAVTSANKPHVPLLVNSTNLSQCKKIAHTLDGTKLPVRTLHSTPTLCIVTSQLDRQMSSIVSVSNALSKPKVLVTCVQSGTVTSVPIPAKVCIVTTVGNTKFAIHTLNSVAEPGHVHHTTGAQKAVLKPASMSMQNGSRAHNSQRDDVANVNTTTSIMIRDITKKVDSQSDSSNSGASDARHTKLDLMKFHGCAVHSEKTVQNKQLPQETVNSAKHAEKISGQSSKLVQYNLQHGQLINPAESVKPNVLHSISNIHKSKDALRDRTDSNASACKNVNQNVSRLSPILVSGNQKSVTMNGSPTTSLQGKLPVSAEQSDIVTGSMADTRPAQTLVGQGGRTVAGQPMTTACKSQFTATSNLDSGTATAAIQAVAAHVKATQGAASQPAVTTSPPEQQKRNNQPKGISILRPLYDRELDLEDNTTDLKRTVPQIPVTEKKQISDSQTVSKKVEDNSGSHSKIAYDNTAFSIAQILDHAKRAMAEEKQQKESKATTMKEKSKSSAGKGSKQSKQAKPTAANKVAVQTAATAVAPRPVAHDFPFSSNSHLSNFVQKSKQTPAVMNSTVHTPAHPIMAPEFHLNLTESVQKVMQAIPGTDALSPPPCPPKIIRPGSVFTKFSEDKKGLVLRTQRLYRQLLSQVVHL